MSEAAILEEADRLLSQFAEEVGSCDDSSFQIVFQKFVGPEPPPYMND